MTAKVARRDRPGIDIWLFAIAWAGGSVAYVPFLTILLPLRVLQLAGSDSIRVLGLITFCGALAASSGAILFGWLSDRSRTRKPWVATGLFLTVALLLCVPLCRSAGMILAVVIVWQLTLNMMLGPLSAWIADRVSPRQTGYLGGLMALSPALGALSGVIATIPGMAGPDARLWIVGAMVVTCVLPAVVLIEPVETASREAAVQRARPKRSFAVTMWCARLLLQIAEAALFAYLLLYFRSLQPGINEAHIARLFSLVLAAAVPLAIIIGRVADRSSRPTRPLAILALCSACGLVALASASTLNQATVAYVFFGLSTTMFLSIHSGQTIRVLPDPAHRGRDLGLFNLTNTIPSLIMPWLTIVVVPERGYPALFAVLAVFALVSSGLLFALKRLD